MATTDNLIYELSRLRYFLAFNAHEPSRWAALEEGAEIPSQYSVIARIDAIRQSCLEWVHTSEPPRPRLLAAVAQLTPSTISLDLLHSLTGSSQSSDYSPGSEAEDASESESVSSGPDEAEEAEDASESESVSSGPDEAEEAEDASESESVSNDSDEEAAILASMETGLEEATRRSDDDFVHRESDRLMLIQDALLHLTDPNNMTMIENVRLTQIWREAIDDLGNIFESLPAMVEGLLICNFFSWIMYQALSGNTITEQLYNEIRAMGRDKIVDLMTRDLVRKEQEERNPLAIRLVGLASPHYVMYARLLNIAIDHEELLQRQFRLEIGTLSSNELNDEIERALKAENSRFLYQVCRLPAAFSQLSSEIKQKMALCAASRNWLLILQCLEAEKTFSFEFFCTLIEEAGQYSQMKNLQYLNEAFSTYQPTDEELGHAFQDAINKMKKSILSFMLVRCLQRLPDNLLKKAFEAFISTREIGMASFVFVSDEILGRIGDGDLRAVINKTFCGLCNNEADDVVDVIAWFFSPLCQKWIQKESVIKFLSTPFDEAEEMKLASLLEKLAASDLFTLLEPQDLNSLFKTLMDSAQWERAFWLLMSRRGEELSPDIFTGAITDALTNSDHWEIEIPLLAHPRFLPTTNQLAALISVAVQTGTLLHLMQLLAKEKPSDPLPEPTYLNILRTAIHCKRDDLMELLLRGRAISHSHLKELIWEAAKQDSFHIIELLESKTENLLSLDDLTRAEGVATAAAQSQTSAFLWNRIWQVYIGAHRRRSRDAEPAPKTPSKKYVANR